MKNTTMTKTRNNPATDKQVAYLNNLRDKAHRIEAAAQSHGHTVYKKPLVYRDYEEERRLGMTTADASELIGAWRRLILYGNMTLALFNIPQVN